MVQTSHQLRFFIFCKQRTQPFGEEVACMRFRTPMGRKCATSPIANTNCKWRHHILVMASSLWPNSHRNPQWFRAAHRMSKKGQAASKRALNYENFKQEERLRKPPAPPSPPPRCFLLFFSQVNYFILYPPPRRSYNNGSPWLLISDRFSPS